jgi:benzoyl-CoA reductase/2-hydroxyglutaryl-CoA dehydratase subunit BcrC/BadD/HgdB
MDMKTLYAVCDRISDELEETNERIKKIPKLSTGDIEYIRGLTSILKSIKTIIAMEEADGYSNNYSYYDGNSYARRGNVRRDNMGRYSGDREDIKTKMHDLMQHTNDEHTRREIQRMIDDMER